MTEPADDDDLDAMMGSMRGMFRDMADEEPPARGLDALMAAARTKAAEMAPEPVKESWWRRTLAMLTRPPVLAAATVVVLVGSTMVLSRRSDMDVDATQRAVDAERPRKQTADAPTETVKKDAAAKDDAPKPDLFNNNSRSVRPAVRPRPPVVARPEAIPETVKVTPRDEVQETKPTVQATEGMDDLGGQERGGDARDAPKPPEMPKPTGAGRPAGNQPAVVDADLAVRPTAPSGGAPSVPQLVKQAESAAGRNDCAAVKATAERIRKLDVATYKTRVVTQAAIKRCL